jgi:acyl-CoA synthetase (AMP-forming)/AMP-acid ligase II
LQGQAGLADAADADKCEQARPGEYVLYLPELSFAPNERAQRHRQRPFRRLGGRGTDTHTASAPACTVRMPVAVLHESLDRWAASKPDTLFAAQAGRQISYADARELTRRLGWSMRSAGLQPGDRVAVLAKNSIEYVLLFYAASRAGVTLVPLNTRLAAEEWAFILADAVPRAVIAEAAFVPAIEALPLAQIVRVALDASGVRRPGWQPFDAWLCDAGEQPDSAPDEDRDLLQLYTSATTGRPKGAVLAQRAVCANVAQISAAVATPPDERSLVVAPLFHAAAVPSTLVPLASGGSVYLQADFRPFDVVNAIAAQRIGYAVLVPTMLQACLAEVPVEAHFETLRLIYYGSSPIAEATLRTVMRSFGCAFMQSYGMTEATQSVTFLTPEDHHRGLQGTPDLLLSAGRAARDTEVRIVDPLDQIRPAYASGEVVVRGPQVMRGYWHQPEATALALRDGWLHTGDIGTLDADGYLTIRDRLKDMIVSGGEKVYPRAIEDVLMRHPAVAEVAVIGVPDTRWGETVKAIIVARAGAAPSAEELITHCRGSLGGFEVPRSIEFIDALPRNAAGKVLKRVLREPYWTDRARQVAGV